MERRITDHVLRRHDGIPGGQALSFDVTFPHVATQCPKSIDFQPAEVESPTVLVSQLVLLQGLDSQYVSVDEVNFQSSAAVLSSLTCGLWAPALVRI